MPTIRIIRGIVLSLFLLLFLASVNISAKEPKVEIYYFYSNVCGSCTEASELINTYTHELSSENNKYELRLRAYNVIESENFKKMMAYFDKYNVPEDMQDYPILFYGNRYYQGEDIADGILEIDEDLKKGLYLVTENIEIESNITKKMTQKFKSMTIINIIIAGMVNGLNPCGLSMVLFLVTLFITKRNVNILKIGTAFAIGKVITYILLGTALYNVLSMIDMQVYNKIIKMTLMVYLIVIVGMNIFDYYNLRNKNYGNVKNQLPSSLRKWNHKVIQKFTNIKKSNLLLVTVLLGCVVSVGEFLCTGQVYVASIVYLYQIEKTISIRAFIYLCVYSIAFIIPLMLVVYGIHRTRSTLLMSDTILRRLPLIKIVTSIVLIIIGIAIIIYL